MNLIHDYLKIHFNPSFIITYKTKLNQFRPAGTIKVAEESFNSSELLKEMHKEDRIPALNIVYFKNIIERFPKTIKVSLYITINNPRVMYLVFPKIKFGPRDAVIEKLEDYTKQSVTHGIKIHPISVFTLNNWIFINNFFINMLKKNKIPFEPALVNSLKSDVAVNKRGKISIGKEPDISRNQRFGENYLKFVGDIDLAWVSKPNIRRKLFSTNKDFEAFITREQNKDFHVKKAMNSNEIYREAVRMALQDVMLRKFDMNSPEYQDAISSYMVMLKQKNS